MTKDVFKIQQERERKSYSKSGKREREKELFKNQQERERGSYSKSSKREKLNHSGDGGRESDGGVCECGGVGGDV